MPENFTWVETHKQLARKLLEYKDKQEELIKILENAGANVDKKDLKIQNRLDTFSFFALINNFETEKRLEILQNISRIFDLPYPTDVNGIIRLRGKSVIFESFEDIEF